MVRTTIQLTRNGLAPPVFLAGSFTQWQPSLEMEHKINTTETGNESRFYKDVDLQPGEYQYKFRLGYGDWWIVDDSAPIVKDASGNINNSIKVQEAEVNGTAGSIATNIPKTAQESIVKADASPKAITEPTVVAEKRAVERELQNIVPVQDSAGESAPTISATATTVAPEADPTSEAIAPNVPSTVVESIMNAHAPPEAVTESTVVAEKSVVEQELLAKVPVEHSTGEPVPTLSAATVSAAPVQAEVSTSADEPVTFTTDILGDHKSPVVTVAESISSSSSGSPSDVPVMDTLSLSSTGPIFENAQTDNTPESDHGNISTRNTISTTSNAEQSPPARPFRTFLSKMLSCCNRQTAMGIAAAAVALTLYRYA